MSGFARGLGLLLIVLGAAIGVAEMLFYLTQGGYQMLSLGTIWYRLNANSLVGFQATIEQGLGEAAGPLVWGVAQSLLTWPAWLVLPIPGLILYLLGRTGGEDRRRGAFG